MSAVSKDVKAAAPARISLVAKIAAKYSVDPDKLMGTLKATVFRGSKQKDGSVREATNEELLALMVVADQYNLNPFTREIYAFPDDKRGGIVPVVSVDGWLRMINERPELRSIEIAYGGFDLPSDDPASDPYVEVTIARSDRSMPVVVREYMRECFRDTGPWNSHPRRMLRWKAIIQAGRVAFGFGGIYDPDEADRIREAIDVTPTTTVARKPETQAPKEKASAALPLITRDELLHVLDSTGISEAAVCEKFKVGHIDELGEEGLRLAKHWAETVNG